MQFDRLQVGLFAELFASVPEEMGFVLERSSFSPNIKERRDYSCALFDKAGNLISQAAHIPVHLGAMEFLMKKWLEEGPRIEIDKLYITNDPYFAGTHLPDISVIKPIALEGKLIGYAASRAHHSDVGGTAPGSMAPADSVEDEGVLISPSELTSELIADFANRTREPRERHADIRAQVAAVEIGADRYRDLARRFGDRLEGRVEECLAYTDRMTRTAIQAMPDGVVHAEDCLEDIPSPGDRATMRVLVQVLRDTIRFDFSGTDAQSAFGINATEAVTRSACYYVVRCLAGTAMTNGGCWSAVEVIAPKASLVCAAYPAPVVGGNTETSQRIVDLLLQALAKLMPNRIPACSQGTMNNVALGTESWAYYETIGGGCGGGPNRCGASGIHSHMTNTRNTPIEALEISVPLRVMQYELRRGSGGSGKHLGGDGVVREIEILDDETWVTLLTERRTKAPPGAHGGSDGSVGTNSVEFQGKRVEIGSKAVLKLQRGSRIRIETPGGGGWGRI